MKDYKKEFEYYSKQRSSVKWGLVKNLTKNVSNDYELGKLIREFITRYDK